ncbi:MAG TPA: peptidoglycan -binding protein [Rhodospirillaceae bacterium]|nr:peptidoglycan -binding protein [Rhodospirillaceae bacterium]
MATSAHRARRTVDIWPGWVDALSTLLIIIIFVLLVFVLGQFFLSQALSGRDQALAVLNRQVSQLGAMLSLERQARSELETTIGRLSGDLQAANQELDILDQLKLQNFELTTQLNEKGIESVSQREEIIKLQESLTNAATQAEGQRVVIEKQIQQLAVLQQNIKALESLKTNLETQIAQSGEQISKEQRLSAEARAQATLMSQQLEILQQELGRLAATLDASDALTIAQKAQISDLGRRMNRALAGKVQELQKYRSEFFGRLREILGNRPGVTVAGDRFVFQSEVLFASGSADIGIDGQRQLAELARTLINISRDIPQEITWLLRVDGHTDTVPINTARFKSNWELSTARAVSVVNFLIEQGLPPNRLAAAGFGEYQPLDPSARDRNRRIELKLDQF